MARLRKLLMGVTILARCGGGVCPRNEEFLSRGSGHETIIHQQGTSNVIPAIFQPGSTLCLMCPDSGLRTAGSDVLWDLEGRVNKGCVHLIVELQHQKADPSRFFSFNKVLPVSRAAIPQAFRLSDPGTRGESARSIAGSGLMQLLEGKGSTITTFFGWYSSAFGTFKPWHKSAR